MRKLYGCLFVILQFWIYFFFSIFSKWLFHLPISLFKYTTTSYIIDIIDSYGLLQLMQIALIAMIATSICYLYIIYHLHCC